MTEKRFKLGYVCGDYGLIDNNEWIDLHSMSENSEKNVQICINKMNELADENEQLKSSDTITDLETEIMNLKTTIQQLRTDNTKQKKLLNTTMKENEHIKQTIKDMINTERTELGKMTLRHLWRQIQ